MIVSLILMTLICDSGVILGGKSDAYHFMGVKGLNPRLIMLFHGFASVEHYP